MTTNNSKLPTRGRSVRVSGAEDPGWPELTIRTSHHSWRTVSLCLVPVSSLSSVHVPAAVEGLLLTEVSLQDGVDGERYAW